MWKRARPWPTAAFLLALAASLTLLFAPLGSRVESTAGGGSIFSPAPQHPRSEPEMSHVSLLEEQGWSVALPLAIPVALAGAGLAAGARGARRSLIVLAALLGAFVVVGALSVGIFYLPAEAALIVAGVKEGRP